MAESPFILECTVNGVPRTLETEPMARLLDVLRTGFGLTGTKEGCGEGECGACSVLLDGQLVNSCLVPAVQAQGRTVTTVEGLAGAEGPSRLQTELLTRNGAQCGFCTPGMVVAGQDHLDRGGPDAAAAISGNLCRCTGYARILEALAAAGEDRP